MGPQLGTLRTGQDRTGQDRIYLVEKCKNNYIFKLGL